MAEGTSAADSQRRLVAAAYEAGKRPRLPSPGRIPSHPHVATRRPHVRQAQKSALVGWLRVLRHPAERANIG
jgi:hypothetical protein